MQTSKSVTFLFEAFRKKYQAFKSSALLLLRKHFAVVAGGQSRSLGDASPANGPAILLCSRRHPALLVQLVVTGALLCHRSAFMQPSLPIAHPSDFLLLHFQNF